MSSVSKRIATDETLARIAQVMEDEAGGTTHAGKAVTDTNGVHGFRVNSTTEKPQYYDDTNEAWVDVKGLMDPEDVIEPSYSLPGSPSSGRTVLYLGPTLYRFDAVTPAGTEDPAEEHWYEYDSSTEQYTLSEDTTVTSGKTYYAKSPRISKNKIYRYSNGAWNEVSIGEPVVPIAKSAYDSLSYDDKMDGTVYFVPDWDGGTIIRKGVKYGSGGGTSGGCFRVRITANAYAGETVTLTDGTNTYTGTLSSLGIAEIIVEQPGAYVATAAGDEIGAVNIGMYSIENDGIFGFIEHMGTEATSQRVEYIGINEDYNPISITMGGGYNLGDWANYKWLRDNLPYMVKKDGTVDYALNPNDYTEKANGNASDYSNSNYAGAGGFSWADKIYKRVTYSGTDRKVEFCFSPRGGFDPVGFEDKNGNVLQGRWIPMQYPQNVNNEPKTIAGGMPWTGQTTADQVTAVGTIGSKANFLGGPFVETLIDLMIMFAKTTDLQDFYGYGACNRGSQQVIAQTVVNGGQFYGTTDKTSYNKIFHSVVLGSYMVWCRDPYELCVSGTLKVSKNYSIDLTGATYTNTGKTYTTTSGWQYPDKYEEVSGYGSVPVQPCGGTTATGGCDGLYVNAGITAVSLRFGSCGADLIAGPRARGWAYDATAANWNISFAVLLDPPVGVRPNAA